MNNTAYKLTSSPSEDFVSNDNVRSIATLVDGDCLKLLTEVPGATVDLVVLDLPYGTTKMAWDKVIEWEPLWTELRRVLTDTGTVVAFGSQPFTTDLIASARDLFKYSLVWKKNRTTNFLHAKNRVLRSHEDVIVFSKGTAIHANRSTQRMTYNPQGLMEAGERHYRGKRETTRYMDIRGANANANLPYHAMTNYPRSVLSFAKDEDHFHPTQKPVDLLRYLIDTFSNPGDIVLDPTMGSGSTGLAAVQAGRHFVGFEADAEFFAIAEDRIDAAKLALNVT